MTTLELKNKVINKLALVDDNEFLSKFYKLLHGSLDDNKIHQLSDNHKNAIKNATNQIQEGDFLNNEQSNKEIDEWLNK